MSSKSLALLVLGVGGNVSQGILKALKISSLSEQFELKVVAACINPLSPGLFTSDRAYISPRADHPDFLNWLIQTCQTENIAGILSGSEAVISVLAQNSLKIKEKSGAVSIVSSLESLAIGDDKLQTARWLKYNGFNYPRTVSIEDIQGVDNLLEECGFPLIAKPRWGKGSQQVTKVTNQRELSFIKAISFQSGYVLQEYLGDEFNEFTVGTLSNREGQLLGSIVMRRELQGGTTFRAEAVDFPAVGTEAAGIIRALKPVGPCNVQLRLSDGKPVCFEINVRFSGTTPIRARLGFNDVETAVRHFVLGQTEVEMPLITSGVALRYWNEIYINPQAPELLASAKKLENPRNYLLQSEDYGMGQKD